MAPFDSHDVPIRSIEDPDPIDIANSKDIGASSEDSDTVDIANSKDIGASSEDSDTIDIASSEDIGASIEDPDPIDIANSKDIGAFSRQYLPEFDSENDPPSTKWQHPKSGRTEYTISLRTSSDLSERDLDTCFELVKLTSMEDYLLSKDGWNPRAKLAEMRLLDLKYLFIKSRGRIRGFASLMPTYEDGHPVLYCYEVHLRPEVQGKGLGTLLMSYLSTIAKNIPTCRKIMLTCYRRNEKALSFYANLGFKKDKFSPKSKVLRNGTKVKSAYLILSKKVR